MAKRKLKRDNGHGLGEDQAHFLLHGFCFDGHQPNYGHPRVGGQLERDCPFPTLEAMAQSWNDNRDHLMAQAKPWTRPDAWWRFSAPEPRLNFSKWFGCGAQGWSYYDLPDGLFGAKPAEVKESEKDYLLRHPDLLTDAEKKILSDEAKTAE